MPRHRTDTRIQRASERGTLKAEEGRSHQTLTFLLGARSREKLVEDVECALVFGLPDHASLLQQISL